MEDAGSQAIKEIVRLLGEGKTKNAAKIQAILMGLESLPQAHSVASGIVDSWPASSTFGPLTDNKALVGGGVGIAGLASVPYLQEFLAWIQREFKLPLVTSPITMLFIVAGLGALAGAVYSIFKHGGIAWPTIGLQGGEDVNHERVLTLTRYGILNESGVGALAAVSTIWLTTIGLIPPEGRTDATPPTVAKGSSESPSKQNEQGTPESTDSGSNANKKMEAKNLLSYSVLIGALVSGWLGARMRSFRLDQGLMKSLLASAVASDRQSREVQQKVETAPGAVGIAQALGFEVVGGATKPPPPRTPPTEPKSPLELQLFQLLNEAKVRAATGQLGPLTSAATGLTLGLLESVRTLDPVIRQVLDAFTVNDVAAMEPDDFISMAKERGLDVSQVGAILRIVHSAAKNTAVNLKQQPGNWSWPPPS